MRRRPFGIGALMAVGWAIAATPPADQGNPPFHGPLGTRWLIDVPLTQAPAEAATLADRLWRALTADLQHMGPFTVHPARGAAPPLVPPALRVSTRVDRNHSGQLTAHVEVVDLRTNTTLLKRGYSDAAEASLTVAHHMADDVTEQATGLRGVAESRITFAMDLGPGVKEIFEADRVGEHPRQLTFFRSLTTSPTVARDGRLAFVTYKGGPSEVWGQRVPGGAFVRLFPVGHASALGVVSAPAWSPDGSQLAFVQEDRHGHSDLFLLDLARGHLRQLTSEQEINTEPAWNPNGTEIAFTSNREGQPHVYALTLATGQARRISAADRSSTSPDWSPNGDALAYATRDQGRFQIYVQPLAGGPARAVSTGEGSFESPTWSPDGRWLLFIHRHGGTTRFQVGDPTGGAPQALGTLTRVQAPDWSRVH